MSAPFIFTQEQVIQILESSGIHYQIKGRQINADLAGTGHHSIKITPHRGWYLDASTGRGGRISTLLRGIGAVHCPGPVDHQSAHQTAKEKEEQEKRQKRAKSIWTDGWSCSSPDEVYAGPSLDSSDNILKKGALRAKWHTTRDAAFSYLANRQLDQRWMPQLRLFLLNLQEKDDYAMHKNGAVGGIAMPMLRNKVIVGVQRLYLDASGKKVSRMMLGRLGDMTLKPLDAERRPLVLTAALAVLLWGEGWETCAHSVQASHWPCIVLYTAGEIWRRASLYLAQSKEASPEQVGRLPVMGLLVDRDASNTGQNACYRATQILRQAGITSLYLLPPDIVKGGEKGADWSDAAEEFGHVAMGKALMLAAQNQPVTSDLSADTEEPAYNDHEMGYEIALANAGIRHHKQNWRKSENSNAAARPTIHDVDTGRAILKTGIEHLVDDYVDWLDQHRQANAEAEAEAGEGEGEEVSMVDIEFKPYLFKPTCGSGKSTELKKMPNNAKIQQANGALRHFVSTNKECESFVDFNPLFFWYHGRNPDPDSLGYCKNYEQMMQAVKNGHVPQAEFCFNCKYGLKWAIETSMEASEKHQNAIKKLAIMGITGDPLDAIDPCVWQDHLRDALGHQFVVGVHFSYSENLSKWHRVDENEQDEIVPALVSFDEDVPFAGQLEKITHEKVDEWAQRNVKNIRYLRYMIDNKLGNPIDLKKELQIAEASQDALVEMAREFAEMTGKSGRITPDSPVWQAVDALINIDHDDGRMLAIWEKLEFERYGDLSASPLRGAYALAQTLKVNDGHIEHGGLYVSATKPVLERIGRLPTALFNATPSPVDEAVIKAKKGVIIDVIVKQHVKIVRRTNRFYGLRDFTMGGERLITGVGRYQKLVHYFSERKFIIHRAAQDILDPEGKNSNLGHWGADHRAQNRFEHDNLVIAGSFHMPAHAARHTYQAHRLAALTAGADPKDWPLMQDFTPVIGADGKERDDAFQYEEVWVFEGNGIEVKSFMPLPRQSEIRAWYLKLVTIETVQAIGRVRAVNAFADSPILVDIFGGVPLQGLAEYGLVIDEYLDDPVALGFTTEERNQAEHHKAMSALTQAALQTTAEGSEITRSGLNARVQANRAEAIEKQRQSDEQGQTQGVCATSVIYNNTETAQTPQQAQAQAVHQVHHRVYKTWLEKVGLPVFADLMQVNGRAAAAVRAAQEAIRNQSTIDCDKLFQMLEEWAKTAVDDGLTSDEAAENDRDSRDLEKRRAAVFYRKQVKIRDFVDTGDEAPKEIRYAV